MRTLRVVWPDLNGVEEAVAVVAEAGHDVLLAVHALVHLRRDDLHLHRCGTGRQHKQQHKQQHKCSGLATAAHAVMGFLALPLGADTSALRTGKGFFAGASPWDRRWRGPRAPRGRR